MKRSISLSARLVASLALPASLVALKVAAMLYARHCGFAQVSDDDYARVVIAQTFVHAPHLDPSGTSWLPFPFWLYGVVMMIVGRSLEIARALAFGLGALSAVLPYVALRSMQTARFGAWVGAALAALTPWSVWLGLAPVPEAWAAACAASALFFLASRARGLGAERARHALIASGLVLVATLSRYESWPLAALVAGVCVARARKLPAERITYGIAALVASFGPMAWLVNNAIAHGDAFHFVARVAAFRRANAGSMPMGARIIEYPLALLRDAPEIVIAAIVGTLVVLRGATRDFLARWSIPLVGAALVLAFLIYGDIRDGAPTHHAARALLPVMFVLAGFAGAAFDEVARQGLGRIALAVLAMMWLAFIGIRVRDIPGNGDARREPQIARGRALASEVHLDVTPCTYEHFALIAAYGAPERVTIEPLTHEPVTPTCPHVTFLASDALR